MRREVIIIIFGVILTVAILIGIGVGLSMRQDIAKAEAAIDLAGNHAADGEWNQVIEVLDPYTENPPRTVAAGDIWKLLAQAHDELGHTAQAASLYERIAADAAEPTQAAEALLRLAEIDIESGDLSGAEEQLAKIDEIGVPGFEPQVKFIESNIAYEEGDEELARDILAEIRSEYPDVDNRDEVEQRLSALNLELLFGGAPDDNDLIHVIEAGDTLWDLGREYGVSSDLIERINGLTPSNMRQGRRIKIPINDFHLEVYKEDFLVYVFDGDEFFARYPCRVGREDWMTPEGEFTIGRRQINPQWTNQQGEVIAPGDPNNELGTRWLGFTENPSIGIHGTIHPESIGSKSSSGCVGLLRQDVEQLYDLISRGTEVTIFASRSDAERGRD